MSNLDSFRCWRCTLCPCKVRNKFLVNFWNRTILLCIPCILLFKDCVRHYCYVWILHFYFELSQPAISSKRVSLCWCICGERPPLFVQLVISIASGKCRPHRWLIIPSAYLSSKFAKHSALCSLNMYSVNILLLLLASCFYLFRRLKRKINKRNVSSGWK